MHTKFKRPRKTSRSIRNKVEPQKTTDKSSDLITHHSAPQLLRQDVFDFIRHRRRIIGTFGCHSDRCVRGDRLYGKNATKSGVDVNRLGTRQLHRLLMREKSKSGECRSRGRETKTHMKTWASQQNCSSERLTLTRSTTSILKHGIVRSTWCVEWRSVQPQTTLHQFGEASSHQCVFGWSGAWKYGYPGGRVRSGHSASYRAAQ